MGECRGERQEDIEKEICFNWFDSLDDCYVDWSKGTRPVYGSIGLIRHVWTFLRAVNT